MFSLRTATEAAIVLAAASDPSTVAAQSPVDPLTIPARASRFREQVCVRRLPDAADRQRLIDTHRMFRPEHRRIVLTPQTASRWLVIAPAQRTGSYRLRVRLDAGTAGAGLDPPRGRVNPAFATPRRFVALPGQVKRIDWLDICAPVSAPSAKGSGSEGSGAPGR